MTQTANAPAQLRSADRRRARARRRRGVALMLVIGAVAIAAILGAAMLSTATLQNRAGANRGRSSCADYLGESGLNLALYYLQYPEKAPGYVAGGSWYWPGTGGPIAINSGVAGTVAVTVTRATDTAGNTVPWTYEVACTAKSGPTVASEVTKTTGARVYVRNEYVVKHQAAFNASTAVPAYVNIQGDIWSAGTFGLKVGSPAPTLSGDAYCASLRSGLQWLPLAVGKQAKSVPAADLPAPTLSSLNTYATYTVNEVTRSRQELSSSSLNAGDIPTVPAPSNPAGIYYKDVSSSGGVFTINDNVVINGTLIVVGNVQMKGANVTIHPQSGYPGLVVTGTLEIFQPLKSLTVNGVCFVGGQLKTNNNGTIVTVLNASQFRVNGALLMGTTTPDGAFFTGYNAITTVKPGGHTKVPDLTANYRVPKGVSIVRWGLP
ncbi:MAG TPA: hypothetical protein VER17_00580 [Tepidisphaeraceae bacterium]|nr:hypothetical protein [Tepidisphaeraceae bacterium]